MTDQILVTRSLLRRVSSELLFYYAAQNARCKHGQILAIHQLQLDRLEGVLREIDGVLKKGTT
jgi:hypothetical protein